MNARAYLTTEETAAYLEELGAPLAEKTLRAQRCKGGGIPFVKIGGKVRYRRQDIDAFLQKLPALKSTSDGGRK